jgi:hypothetical protein
LTDSRLGVGRRPLVLVDLLPADLGGDAVASRALAASSVPAIVLGYPAIFSLFVASTFVVGPLAGAVWGTGAQQASTDSRIDQWNMAIPRSSTTRSATAGLRGARTLGFTNGDGVAWTIDSYYISILLETGILGFILY